jgi:glycosyltransferase involved in cell wall biosynthesis
MKILLSAFSCDPRRGSEPGVGWNWAIRVARLGHEVWVITRGTVARDAIEEAIAREGLKDRLRFSYCDPKVPRWVTANVVGYNLFCTAWQIAAYRVAKQLHREVRFDAVHHVTFCSVRFGSLMGLLGVPFTFGPVSGGQRIPPKLRRSFPIREKLRELLRDLSNWSVTANPLPRIAFRTAQKIVVANPETAAMVPLRYRHKCSVQLPNGVDVPSTQNVHSGQQSDERLRVLYVGMFQPLKGIHLALRAFARLRERFPRSEFTLIGGGIDEKRLKKLADTLDLGDSVQWTGWKAHSEVLDLYSGNDLFLFPSLRDTSATVILEAFANALPVICLNLGGSRVLVNNTCGRVIDASGSEDDIVGRIADALIELAGDKELVQRLKAGAIERVRSFQWDSLVETYYSPVESRVAMLESSITK